MVGVVDAAKEEDVKKLTEARRVDFWTPRRDMQGSATSGTLIQPC